MQVECEICDLITTSDNADLIEGDGYVTPSEYWVCRQCQYDESQYRDEEDKE
jgi:uncharacterized protein YlaI